MKHGVICRSGEKGWQGRLKENYSSFEDFEGYDQLYNLAYKLGYKSAINAWNANPVVQGSTNPNDFRKVRAVKR